MPMRAIPPEAIDLLERELPDFVKDVERCADGTLAGIVMSIDGFADDPILFHAMVWYAYDKGAELTLMPRPT